MKYLILILLIVCSLFSKENELSSREKNWIENNTITVGIETAKPYIYYNNLNNDVDGLYGDILKLVAQKSGLKVKYVKGEWSELLESFKNKKLDLLPATFYNKQREKFGLYSESYYKVREYIYVKNESGYTGFKDLKNKKVAIVKGYATIAKIEKQFPSIQIVQTENLTQSVSMLQNNLVDALIDYHLVVETYLRDNSIIGLKSVAQSELDPISVHYLSHIEKTLLHSILQKSLNSISREEMNTLLRQWVRYPYEENILTKGERNYINNKLFNVYVNNWEPFTSFKSGTFDGLSVDIWKKIVEKTNINYKMIYVKDFSQMLKNIKHDPNGIIISTSQTKDRDEYAVFSKKYASFPIGIATKTKEKYIIDFNSLNGKKIAVGKNYTAYKLLKKHYKDIEFIQVKSTQEALTLLSKEKVYAVADILPVLINKMDKYHYNDIKISGEENLGFNLKVMVNNQSEKLVEVLNKAIEKLENESQVKEITNKWITKTRYIESSDYSLVYKALLPALIITVILLILYFSQRKSNKIIENQKEELKNLNKRFELTLEAVEDGIWDWDVRTNYLYFSKNWAGMLGYEIEDLENHLDTFYTLLHPDDEKSLSKVLELHFKDPINNKFNTRIRLKCKDGTYKWVRTRGKLTLNKENEPIRMLGYHSDISSEIKHEEHIKSQDKVILEQSKLAAMGEMIGNIAHQWRQPLNVISTGATGLKVEKDFGILTDERFEQTCDAIEKNAKYLSETIDDFKNFIKGDRKKVKFELSENIKNFLSLVEGSIKSNDIQVVKNLDNNILLESYPNDLIQCFMNLFNNSKDAFIEKEQESRFFFITTYSTDKNIIISIKDNAGGIPKDVISKVFTPYFTTKEQTQGTGLGLSMTYNLIVEGMKGSIDVSNIEYEYEDIKLTGVEFTIKLPLNLLAKE